MIYIYNTTVATSTLLEISKVFVGDTTLYDKDLKLKFRNGLYRVYIKRTTNCGVTTYTLKAHIDGSEIKTVIKGEPLNTSPHEFNEKLLRFMNSLDAHVEISLETRKFK